MLQEAKRAQQQGALDRLSEAEQRKARLQDLCKLFDGFDAERAAEDAERATAAGGKKAPGPPADAENRDMQSAAVDVD